ncbi:MAG: fluoride efflux transporter CrcB [Ginsengibacter sp.]
MKEILTIGTGSFIGGILRYSLSQFIQGKTNSAFPYGTLCVNIAGCFLIGIVFGICERGNINFEWRLFLATGILGGFTTFSAFSYESVALMRGGEFLSAFAYVAISVFIGLLATFTGMSIIKII